MTTAFGPKIGWQKQTLYNSKWSSITSLHLRVRLVFTCHLLLWGVELEGVLERSEELFKDQSEIWSSSSVRALLQFKYIFKYQGSCWGGARCPAGDRMAPALAWRQHPPAFLGIPAVSFCVQLTILKVLGLCVLTCLARKDFCKASQQRLLHLRERKGKKKEDQITGIVLLYALMVGVLSWRVWACNILKKNTMKIKIEFWHIHFKTFDWKWGLPVIKRHFSCWWNQQPGSSQVFCSPHWWTNSPQSYQKYERRWNLF